MRNPSLVLTFAAMTLAFAAGCTSKSKQDGAGRANAGTEEVGDDYVTLEFKRGSTKLNEISKADLNLLAERAKRDGREIEDIKILAWADREYPETSKRGTPKDVILAKERAQSVRSYLEEDLHTQEEIDAFNMAKRPNLASTVFQGEDWSVKEAFEQSGASSSRRPDGTVSYTKASKALVIIDYKEGQK